MGFIQSILMGIVQGLSEFLPISSSAHLVFTSNFYKVFKEIPISEANTQEVFLDIMLHLGTLIAVLIFFRKEVYEIAKDLFVALKNRKFDNYNAKLGLYILLATFITVILALPFEKIANHLVFHPALVGGLLIVTGLILFYSEYLSKKKFDKNDKITLKQSLLIGLAQGLAVLPGFSRSGWTIATGLFTGLDRETSAKFSFLLSIPIILGSSMVYPLLKIDIKEAMTYNWSAIIISTIVSGIVGYICIKYFMKFISKFSLNIFGYYCIIIGFLTIILFNIFR